MGTRLLRVLGVEDDPFQRNAMRMIIDHVATRYPNLTVSLTLAESGKAGLDACRGSDGFDLVLLDYKLPGGDADTVLPALRKELEQVAAIIVLSGNAQEAPMQRCWLDLGADSYRIKPISRTTLEELVDYTLQKQNYLQKRRRAEGEAHDLEGGTEPKRTCASDLIGASDSFGSYGTSDGMKESGETCGEWNDADLATSDLELNAPGFLSILSEGRRGPVRLGFAASKPVAIKVMDRRFVRGPPPPEHPHVNTVMKRLLKGEQCVEIRTLCDGGELFDSLVDENECGLPVDKALFFVQQLMEAVAHCHEHGAVHGQLHAENLLLRDERTVQVTGFSRCHASGSSEAVEWSLSDGRKRSQSWTWAVQVDLRPAHPFDAPELKGRTQAAAHELLACDIWSVGVILVYLLTGQPDSKAPKCGGLDAAATSLGFDVQSLSINDGGSTPPVGAVAHRAAFALAEAMLQDDPAVRPSASRVVQLLRRLAPSLSPIAGFKSPPPPSPVAMPTGTASQR